MALKKPVRNVTIDPADALADRLADRPYGQDKPEAPVEDVVARTTISLPKSLLVHIEDMAHGNKRGGDGPKTVSGIIKVALEEWLTSPER